MRRPADRALNRPIGPRGPAPHPIERGEDETQVLPVDARIRRSRDFGSVLKRGRRAARGGVVVHWAPPAETGQDSPEDENDPTTPSGAAPAARAGFVVSKAVGNAVVRNKVKRRLRHAAAEQMRSWPPGTDVVVRATPKAAERDFAGLGRDLADAVERARNPKSRGRSERGTGAARRDRS